MWARSAPSVIIAAQHDLSFVKLRWASCGILVIRLPQVVQICAAPSLDPSPELCEVVIVWIFASPWDFRNAFLNCSALKSAFPVECIVSIKKKNELHCFMIFRSTGSCRPYSRSLRNSRRGECTEDGASDWVIAQMREQHQCLQATGYRMSRTHSRSSGY